MAATYHASVDLWDYPSNTETPFTTATNQMWNFCGAFVLYNKRGSGKLVRLIEHNLQEIVWRTTGGNPGLSPIFIDRITALTGGVDIPVFKLDTTAPTLPSQVRVCYWPETVTTSGTPYRYFLGGGQNLYPQGVPSPGILRHRGAGHPVGGSAMFAATGLVGYNADCQPIILREGEGLALTQSGVSNEPYPIEVSITFSTSTSPGEDYVATYVVPISSKEASFAIWNGSGSGEILYVHRLEITEPKTVHAVNQDAKRLILETVSHAEGGDEVTAVPLDTQSGALGSGILVARRAQVVQVNRDAQWGSRRAGSGDQPFRARGCGPDSVGIVLPAVGLCSRPARDLGGRGVFSAHSARRGNEIVLEEGSGVALLQRVNQSGTALYHADFLFTVEPGAGSLTRGEVY